MCRRYQTVQDQNLCGQKKTGLGFRRVLERRVLEKWPMVYDAKEGFCLEETWWHCKKPMSGASIATRRVTGDTTSR